jgi:hypothetical protein
MYSLRFFVFVFNLIFIVSLSAQVFGQEVKPKDAPGNLSKELENAFREAIKSTEKDKQAEQEALAGRLKGELKTAGGDWITAARNKRAPEKNQLVDQKWEEAQKAGPYVHYEYYLRDYVYQQNSFDIIKTDSLVVPYKGYIQASQILYVERQHPYGAPAAPEFIYTVTVPVKLSFDYQGNRFELVNTENGEPSLAQGWPEELLRRLKQP